MKKQDQKMITDAYNIIKELTPVIEAMKDIAQERKKLYHLIKSIEPFVEPMEELADKVRDYYDDKSQRWQESDKGYVINEQASLLESIASNLRELSYELDDLQNYKEGAY